MSIDAITTFEPVKGRTSGTDQKSQGKYGDDAKRAESQGEAPSIACLKRKAPGFATQESVAQSAITRSDGKSARAEGTGLAEAIRKRLTGLLDYVEQVIRLDERVVFRLAEYRMPDGSNFAVGESDTRNLPGVQHDVRDEEGPVWLELARLARRDPPKPSREISDWVAVSGDPAQRPKPRPERIITVTAVERDAALAKGEVREGDVVEAPKRRNAPVDAPPLFDLTLRLEDRPTIAASIEEWISGPLAAWAVEEIPRRRTIALYQQFYKVFQLMEAGVDSSIEVVWGVGIVHWHKDGRVVDRPLLEMKVDVELDETKGGLIRIRPTSAEPAFDLKPYEEFGCDGLSGLADLIRREIRRVSDEDGLSPFNRDSFEMILSSAASRLDAEGSYAPDAAPDTNQTNDSQLTVTDRWVLFARPRSQHVVLQDIERLRRVAGDPDRAVGAFAERLVTEPSTTPTRKEWAPLGSTLAAIMHHARCFRTCFAQARATAPTI